MTTTVDGPIAVVAITFDPERFWGAMAGCLLVDGRPATARERHRFRRFNALEELFSEIAMVTDEAAELQVAARVARVLDEAVSILAAGR